MDSSSERPRSRRVPASLVALRRYAGGSHAEAIEERCRFLRPRADICVVCLSEAWGGLEQVACADALELGALGLRVRMLCLAGTPVHDSLMHRSEVSVATLDFRPRDWLDIKLRKRLHRLIDDGVRVFHLHQTSLIGSVAPWLWARPDVVLIVSRHILNNHDKRTLYHRLLYRRVDALVAMSRTVERNIRSTHRLRPRQLQLIPLGLDFERFDPARVDPAPARAAWGADSGTVVIGMVGRIDPAKGQATFIRAAAGLIRSLEEGGSAGVVGNRRVRFVIVGEETAGSRGEHLRELRAMVAQFGIGDYVVFAGYQEDVPQVMRAFDIFVMPSRQEAFGLVAIEAMAMERPIIISSGGSAEEIIGSGGHGEREAYGLTVRPEDAFDLQRQLRVLLEQPDARRSMGERARAHVSENYDRGLRLRRTLELYELLLRRRGLV